jgi:hypothetical protein
MLLFVLYAISPSFGSPSWNQNSLLLPQQIYRYQEIDGALQCDISEFRRWGLPVLFGLKSVQLGIGASD